MANEVQGRSVSLGTYTLIVYGQLRCSRLSLLICCFVIVFFTLFHCYEVLYEQWHLCTIFNDFVG